METMNQVGASRWLVRAASSSAMGCPPNDGCQVQEPPASVRAGTREPRVPTLRWFTERRRSLGARLGTMNRMEWTMSRQRLGVRRPSGAFGRGPESGRGLPHSKTWRSSPAPS